MNNYKTELLIVGSRHQLLKCESNSINVCDVTVTKSDSLEYLGIYIDSLLNLKEQIREKYNIAAMNLHYIRQIRQYLTTDALVISHLDYGNAIYYGLPKSTLAPLCRIQSMAAKMILKKRKYDSVTEVMIALHWLPIPY